MKQQPHPSSPGLLAIRVAIRVAVTVAVMVTSATGLLAGCAAGGAGGGAGGSAGGSATGGAAGSDQAARHWIEASVVQVLRPADLPSGVDRSCLAVPPAPDQRVTLVRFRVSRAQYLHAFEVPAGVSLNPAERVLVDAQRCEIKAGLGR